MTSGLYPGCHGRVCQDISQSTQGVRLSDQKQLFPQEHSTRTLCLSASLVTVKTEQEECNFDFPGILNTVLHMNSAADSG